MPSAKSVIASNRSPRILIRATNWIGDTVMSMPAVQRLREFKPHAHIALLCPLKLEHLWRRNPFLNELITFESSPDLDDLYDREFDVAVIFPNSFRSAWECRRARIPYRVGYPGDWRRLHLTDVVPLPPGERPQDKDVSVAGKQFKIKTFPSPRHQIHRYLRIVAHLGASDDYARPRIWLANEELPHLTKYFRDDGRPICALNAGAEYGPAKRWMPERFAEVAHRVADSIGCRWLLLGGPRDADIAAVIEKQLRAADLEPDSIINVAGKTTLLELCFLLKTAKLLLANDSGPMHIAYALGTPVVAIFGSTSPQLTGPLGNQVRVVRHQVECSPCFLRECPIDFRCMDRISVEEVVDNVLVLLRPEVEARLRI